MRPRRKELLHDIGTAHDGDVLSPATARAWVSASRKPLVTNVYTRLPERSRRAALLAFCAEHGIVAVVEVLPLERVDEALDRLARNDVRYRFVLDMSDLK